MTTWYFGEIVTVSIDTSFVIREVYRCGACRARDPEVRYLQRDPGGQVEERVGREVQVARQRPGQQEQHRDQDDEPVALQLFVDGKSALRQEVLHDTRPVERRYRDQVEEHQQEVEEREQLEDQSDDAAGARRRDQRIRESQDPAEHDRKRAVPG